MLNRVRWGGLRTKIIAWSFVPTAIILAAVALVGFYAYQQVTETSTIESSRELARLAASQLASELADYGNTLGAVARTADLASPDPTIRVSGLRKVSNRLAIFDGGTIILDNYGLVVAAEPARPGLIGQDWSALDFYRQMVRSPATVFGQVITNSPERIRVITVAVPITGSEGELKGTLVGMFRMAATSISPFYGSIVRLRIGSDQTAYLIDRTGIVLYHTNTDLIGDDFSTQSVVAQLADGKGGALRTRSLDGLDIVASYSPVPTTDWGLVIEEDWDKIVAPARSYGEFLLILLALGLVAPAILVTVGVSRITDPLQQLVVAARNVASGKLGEQVDIKTRDEVQDLADQFNHMSAHLQESYNTLRAREERLAIVVQGTTDGIWDWDLRSNETYFSPRWKGMLGYADEELENCFETWEKLTHPDDLARANAAVNAYLYGAAPVYELEHRLRHKNGSYRWVLARGHALRDLDGKPYRMAGSHTDITDKKEADEAIRQSEKRFSQVFAASPIAITITSMDDGRYIDANQAWLDLFGYQRDDVIGSSSLNLHIWVRPEQRDEMIRQLRGDGYVRNFEHLARTRAGHVLDVRVSAEIIELNNQKYNLSMVIDVTEQKRADEEIKRQNDYLAALHETTLGIISRLDAKELMEAIVDRARVLVGAPYGFVYLVSPDKKALHATVQTGPFKKYVGTLLKPGEGVGGKVWQTGEPVAVADYATWEGRAPVFDSDMSGPEMGVPLKSGNEVVGVIGLTRNRAAPPFRQDEIDLMSRLGQLASLALENARLHTSLQESEARFRAVFEGAAISIAVADRDGHLLETNPATERILGYTFEELAHMSSNDFTHPDDMAKYDAADQEMMAGKRDSYQVEKRYVRKDGHYVWGRMSNSLTRDAEGKPSFIIAMLEDITAQKQAQIDLEQSFATLERRVQERTKELATLNSISASVSRSLDLREILNDALLRTMQVAGLESGVAYRLNGADQTLRMMAHHGLSKEFIQGMAVIPVQSALAGKSLHESEPVTWHVERDYPAGEMKDLIQREGLESIIAVPLVAKGRVVGGFVMSSKTGLELKPDELVLLAAIGQQVGIGIENARLYEAERERRSESERRRRVAEGLRDILNILNSNRPLHEMLDFLVRQAAKVLEADGGLMCRYEDSATRIAFEAASNIPEELTLFIAGPIANSLGNRELLNRKMVIIPDTDKYYAHVLGNSANALSPKERDWYELIVQLYSSTLAVPLVVKGQTYGYLGLFYRTRREFSEEDSRLATTLADQIALAIENAQLRDQVKEAAAINERTRLARELHDSVTQSLYSVTLYSEAAARLLGTGEYNQAADHLREVRDTSQDALREMRLLIFELRPLALDKTGLVGAIQTRLDSVERRGGMKAELLVDGSEHIAPGLQEELYHIAHEGLNNVIKHAHAQRVQVLLHFDRSEIRLEVCDDGDGFDTASLEGSGGLGLKGMRERAARIGGEISVASAPGKGTRLCAIVHPTAQ